MSSPNATLKLLTVDTRKVFSKLLCRTPGGLEEPYVCVVWLEGNDYLTPMRKKFGDRGNFGCHTLKESRGILSTLMKNWTAFSWYRWNIRVYDPNEFVRLKFPKCENFQKREIKALFFWYFRETPLFYQQRGLSCVFCTSDMCQTGPCDFQILLQFVFFFGDIIK